MSDLLSVAEESDIKRNTYQQMLWESENGSEWQRSYAKKELQRYYFKRSNKSFFDKLTLKWLGQLPDKFVLEMDKVKTKPFVSNMTAWLLALCLTGLSAVMLTALGDLKNLSVIVLMFAPLSLLPNPLNWILLSILIWLGWQFRKEIGSFMQSSLFVWSYAVVRDSKSESTEMETGVKTMTYVSGAEKWSLSKKVKAVLLSTLSIPCLLALVLPIAFLPTMIGYSTFVMVYYMKQYSKYKDSIQATIETTRTMSIYKTVLPIQIGVSLALWIFNTPQIDHLLVKLSQLLTG